MTGLTAQTRPHLIDLILPQREDPYVMIAAALILAGLVIVTLWDDPEETGN